MKFTPVPVNCLYLYWERGCYVAISSISIYNMCMFCFDYYDTWQRESEIAFDRIMLLAFNVNTEYSLKIFS